jgi:hypothetical protein
MIIGWQRLLCDAPHIDTAVLAPSRSLTRLFLAHRGERCCARRLDHPRINTEHRADLDDPNGSACVSLSSESGRRPTRGTVTLGTSAPMSRAPHRAAGCVHGPSSEIQMPDGHSRSTLPWRRASPDSDPIRNGSSQTSAQVVTRHCITEVRQSK